MANGRLRAAEIHFLAAVARDGSNVHAHRELAYIYNVQHRLHELNQQMEELAELNAVSFQHLLHWAKTRNGRWNSARDCESTTKSTWPSILTTATPGWLWPMAWAKPRTIEEAISVLCVPSRLRMTKLVLAGTF